jgi:hypothetical protein
MRPRICGFKSERVNGQFGHCISHTRLASTASARRLGSEELRRPPARRACRGGCHRGTRARPALLMVCSSIAAAPQW